MAANPYPNLGWNPVPGIPAEVTSLQRKVGSAATALDNCHKQLEKLLGESSYWQGDAAEEFREAIDGDLPKYIKSAAQSLQKASTQLKNWDGHLTSNRDLAQKYDADAGEKKAAAAKAKGTYEQAGQHPDLKLAGKQFPSQDEADAATARLRAAEKSMNEAAASLEKANTAYNDVTKKAKELETQHADQAETIAKALDGATDKLAPKEGFWSKVGNVVLDVLIFLKDHAGTIGAIAGLLALFPTPFAPIFAGIAIGASALSMGKNLSEEKFRGDLIGQGGAMDAFSAWASIGGDVLGMVPGARLVGQTAREIGDGLQWARNMNVSPTMVDKVKEFGREFGTGYMTAAREGSYGMWQAAGESARGSARLMGDITANGLNVVANTVSSMEEEDALPKEGAAHNAAEDTKAGVGAYGLARLRGLL
jgi:hypothetical protein